MLSKGDDAPPALLASFERAGVEIEMHAGLLPAFAALVRWQGRDRDAGSWGLPQPKTIVLVASRDPWRSLDRFLAAISDHFPHVGVWIGAESLLVEIRAAQSTVGAPPPALRLAGTDAESGGTSRSPQRPDASPSSVAAESPKAPPTGDETGAEPHSPDSKDRRTAETSVTKEEIEMLLRLFDEMRDAPANGPRSPHGPTS